MARAQSPVTGRSRPVPHRQPLEWFNLPTRLPPGLGLGQGVTPQFRRVSQLQQVYPQALLPGQARHHITITTVVATPADHRDLARLGPAFAQQTPGAGAGSLHQFATGDSELLNGDPVELAHLLRPVEGVGELLGRRHEAHAGGSMEG